MKMPDKYDDIRCMVQRLFCENKQRYRYRRIYGLLKREPITISEKVIRQIMREESLIVNSSYGGMDIQVPRRTVSLPSSHWLSKCVRRISMVLKRPRALSQM